MLIFISFNCWTKHILRRQAPLKENCHSLSTQCGLEPTLWQVESDDGFCLRTKRLKQAQLQLHFTGTTHSIFHKHRLNLFLQENIKVLSQVTEYNHSHTHAAHVSRCTSISLSIRQRTNLNSISAAFAKTGSERKYKNTVSSNSWL